MKVFRVLAVSLLWLVAAFVWQEMSPTGIRGESIFEFGPLKAIGGVVLQGTARIVSASGADIPIADLTLGFDAAKTCVYRGARCYALDIDSTLAVRASRWILRHRTAAFSEQVITDDRSANAFVAAEFVSVSNPTVRANCPDGPCYVPPEFHGTRAEIILNQMDFTEFVVARESRTSPGPIMRRLNARQGVRDCIDGQGSYINTDVDTRYIATLEVRGGAARVTVTGTPFRYGWLECDGATRPFIYAVGMLESPKSNTSSAHDEAVAFARAVAVLRAFEYRGEDQLRAIAARTSGHE